MEHLSEESVMTPFPISAVLPIYNCREELERHLRSVTAWAKSVQEIIVVDSGSRDGSLELAEKTLAPFGARFLHNPPGLYQSWNAGIAAATAPWCYLSTVEDPISREGLEHLLEVVMRHDADIVVSPPEMRNFDGSASVDEKMPSHRLADSLTACSLSDRLLTRSESIALLCGFLPHGLLGSSAGNLYRTSLLHRQPFPTDCGHCGDTAWGVKVAPVVRVAFTPRQCSQFYCQTRFRAEDPGKQRARHQQLASLARAALIDRSLHDPEIAVMLGWFEAHDHASLALWNWLADQHAYQEHLQAKYEGGILQYLRRAISDEWKKLRSKS
jgi:glycosyltransferase involved in cell wall biosynthesis